MRRSPVRFLGSGTNLVPKQKTPATCATGLHVDQSGAYLAKYVGYLVKSSADLAPRLGGGWVTAPLKIGREFPTPKKAMVIAGDD